MRREDTPCLGSKCVVSLLQETLQALAEWNQKYDERYGFIFLICATGKSALEMLEALKARMANAPEDEVRKRVVLDITITRTR